MHRSIPFSAHCRVSTFNSTLLWPRPPLHEDLTNSDWDELTGPVWNLSLLGSQFRQHTRPAQSCPKLREARPAKHPKQATKA
jgi:hypothetical protein